MNRIAYTKTALKVFTHGFRLISTIQNSFPSFDKKNKADGCFPIDIVYTWVNQSDHFWRLKREKAISDKGVRTNNLYCIDAIREAEFEKIEALKYSLRSVSRYAGFVRKIFIVTDDQIPEWLDTDHEKIHIISHSELLTDSERSPCFNSHAIEARLHHIKGLSENFLYFNDDFFLGKPVSPDMFFLNKDISRFFPSSRVIDTGPVSSKDLAISAAAKNGQRLLQSIFDIKVKNHISHAPYPLKRSVLFEMEQCFPEEFKRTADNSFRHTEDHSIAAFLFFYYAAFNGRALSGNIQYMYLDNSLTDFIKKSFMTVFVKRYHAFCINEGQMHRKENEAAVDILHRFLKLSFPQKSGFEK